MNQTTLKALKGSIEKWEKIVDCEGQDGGSDNCDLCIEFIEEGKNDCIGCPVHDKTKVIYCDDTPHIKWCEYCYNNNGWVVIDYTVFDQKSYNLALAELQFLKSLLPEE